jgi:hypothetical protein
MRWPQGSKSDFLSVKAISFQLKAISFQLNPLHPRADGDAVAAGFKKRFPFS